LYEVGSTATTDTCTCFSWKRRGRKDDGGHGANARCKLRPYHVMLNCTPLDCFATRSIILQPQLVVISGPEALPRSQRQF
jgi:hypothetical protein